MGARDETPTVCPVCGEEVPKRALACPACGADERSGWGGDASGGLDLPGEDFDYDAFVQDEFGKGPARGKPGVLWWIAGTVLFAALLWLFLAGY